MMPNKSLYPIPVRGPHIASDILITTFLTPHMGRSPAPVSESLSASVRSCQGTRAEGVVCSTNALPAKTTKCEAGA